MNILIPDSWLRDFLKTKATPKQIAECLSLCGPSIERITMMGKEAVYDIEVTTNRIDSMSVTGIAREAAAILPEFGIPAAYVPPTIPSIKQIQGTKPLGITITNDPQLCKRIVTIKLEDIKLGESPKWLQDRLKLVGQRPLNNIIDITNYVMWEMGHPIHAFDYDRLTNKKLIVREAKKHEHLITLDGKKHTLNGGEIIFEDGTGEIIDLPGIMGTQNTVITNKTTNVLLFIENSDAAKIRYTSMGLAIRSQAAVLNEKSPDPELALSTLLRAITIATNIANATVGSNLTDMYPHPQKAKTVSLVQKKLDTYMGFPFPKDKVKRILETLGCMLAIKEHTDVSRRLYTVTPPSWRIHDICIPEDIIEEIARIYGYHTIDSKLPDKAPPVVSPMKNLSWEEEIKTRLRDWGYTETYTYSMISKKQMEQFGFDTQKAYNITNPLSNEWEYMRLSLLPSMITTIQENLNYANDLRLFELSMIYEYQKNDLPHERPTLLVAWSGNKYREAKGLAQSIFSLMGIQNYFKSDTNAVSDILESSVITRLGTYGSIRYLEHHHVPNLSLKSPMTLLSLQIDELVSHAQPVRTYIPIAKFPPIVEDLSFSIIPGTSVDDMIKVLKNQHTLIQSVILLDTYKNNRTFRITYQDPKRTLTDEEIKPIRTKLITIGETKFGATFKTV